MSGTAEEMWFQIHGGNPPGDTTHSTSLRGPGRRLWTVSIPPSCGMSSPQLGEEESRPTMGSRVVRDLMVQDLTLEDAEFDHGEISLAPMAFDVVKGDGVCVLGCPCGKNDTSTLWMKASHVCILLTVHGTRERVRGIQNGPSSSGTRCLTTFKGCERRLCQQYRFQNHTQGILLESQPVPGRETVHSRIHAVLARLSLHLQVDGAVLQSRLLKLVASIPPNATFALQFLRHTRGQNSEVFGATLDGMLQVLSHVKPRPYTPMETALGRCASASTASSFRLPRLPLAFPGEQRAENG